MPILRGASSFDKAIWERLMFLVKASILYRGNSSLTFPTPPYTQERNKIVSFADHTHLVVVYSERDSKGKEVEAIKLWVTNSNLQLNINKTNDMLAARQFGT